MTVFHITYWGPNRQNINEAPWIKRHVESIAPFVVDQYIFHFNISPSRRFNLHYDKSGVDRSSFLLAAPIPWWLIEILSFIGLTYLLLLKARKYDIVNVHIAYPLLTYFHLIKKFFRRPVVVTEHWSAYHFNFGVAKPLPRIRRIFNNELPLLAVSDKLLTDIQHFCGRNIKKVCIVPNGINTGIFHFKNFDRPSHHTFFMLSQWKWPKRPELVIEAFFRLTRMDEWSQSELRIAGDGNKLIEMIKVIDELGIRKNVILLGALTSEEVSVEMNSCSAFLHATEYESFSVVCAEAVCCGTPVVASAVGAIPEFINEQNGILVANNSVDDWLQAIQRITSKSYDRASISKNASAQFSYGTVGYKYFNFLKKVYKNTI